MMSKILTFGFDDCEIYDRRLAEMFRKYGMKATFFLISDQLGFKCDFHRYGEDTVVERVSPEEIKETYRGMEVASHTSAHSMPIDELDDAVVRSCKYLSDLCGYEVKGMAYPGGAYTEEHVKRLKELGIEYSRTIDCTHNFDVPSDFLKWNPTCKYDDPEIMDLADEFINCTDSGDKIFYVYGHSYELTRKEEPCDFESFGRLLEKLSGREDIIYATNIKTKELVLCK